MITKALTKRQKLDKFKSVADNKQAILFGLVLAEVVAHMACRFCILL